jgi:S-formylglutathione hydrolase FrmB
MSQLSFSIYSHAVGGQTSISMILPVFEEFENTIQPGEKFQTLWLLHGGRGDHTDYVRKTAIEKYAVKHKLAVVMPQVGNSFYTDLPSGEKYFTYVSDELPGLLRKYFPLSDKREDNFIAGLSMGGFGAAKIAFNRPQNYAAVGLMSTGPMGPHQLLETMNSKGRGLNTNFDAIFGDMGKIPGSMHDIWYVLEQAVKNNIELPAIYDCCGTEDFTYERFCEFRKLAGRLGLAVTFAEGPGAHTWDFWNEYLPKIIDWLPLKNRSFEENLIKNK